jgi:SAM-dependent methyltransferase
MAIERPPSAADCLALLEARRHALGTRFPRCHLILLCGDGEGVAVARALSTLPAALAGLLGAVHVVVHGTQALPELPPVPRLHVDANPRQNDFGARRKVALDRALARGCEQVIVAEASAAGGLWEVARLWWSALERDAEVALGVPAILRVGAARIANRLVLGPVASAWPADLRFYSAAFLRRAPFRLAADDRRFDTQVLIQARALGIRPLEVRVDGWDSLPGFSTRMSLSAAIAYRLHQVHVLRCGEYLVDHGVRYTLKRSPSSSHAQILAAIPAGARILDLGCSQGLLARELKAKGVHVTGVDVLPPEQVSPHMSAYHQRDLEDPLRLPEGRVFDCVLVSDVIEHVRSREQLLRSVRRHLVADGRLLISTPNIAVWFYRLSLAVGRFEYGPRGVLDETHVHLYTRSTFRREVERGGFRILRERTTPLPFELVLESTGRSRPVAWLTWAYHVLTRLWPGMFAYQFLLEAEVTALFEE